MAGLPAGRPDGQGAAAGLAATCTRLLGRVYGARVVLLVGTGDNGGDALFAGARLAARGARVDALLVGDRAHAAGTAALLAAGGHVHRPQHRRPRVRASAESLVLELVLAADLVVDGVLGIGGRGALRAPAGALAAAAGSVGTAWRGGRRPAQRGRRRHRGGARVRPFGRT